MRHPSKSGRTVVEIVMDEFGKGLVTVDRDDHRIANIDIPEEQLSIDSDPRDRTPKPEPKPPVEEPVEVSEPVKAEEPARRPVRR